MEVGKKYAPPDCPTYMFFQGKALKDVIGQGMLKEIGGRISVGVYSYNRRDIVPVSNTPISRIKQVSGDSPEKIIVASLEGMVDFQPPLIQGKVDVYPNWRTFAIGDIKHLLFNAYMTEIDQNVVHFFKHSQTNEDRTGQWRYQFVGGTEPFDPIVRGFDTWDAYHQLHHNNATDKELYFAILLDPRTLRKISNRFRGENIQRYGEFLNRAAKVDKKIRDFLDYSNEWALKQAKKH